MSRKARAMARVAFDGLTKLIGRGTTRRAALTLLAGLGAARRSRLAPAGAAAKSGKCKTPCAECEQCQTGKCKKKHGKKRCKPGTCQLQPVGTPCGAGGQICQGTSCGCASGQTDSGGVCGTEPSCHGYKVPCAIDTMCCSNFCSVLKLCGCSTAGEACHATSDCCQPPEVPAALSCVGFVCTG